MTDIAVIKVSNKAGLKPARLGSSASLEVGDQVVAIGSPLGLSGTVTEGIVSALNRPVVTDQASDDAQAAISAIQTDAAINPGNSGGALVDMNGAGHRHQLGDRHASRSSTGGGQSGSIGVGFAIPIDQAKRIASQIIGGQTVSHGRLGTTVDGNTSRLTSLGAKLTSIAAGSAAAKAGLKAGDVVTKVNDALIQGGDGLIASIRSLLQARRCGSPTSGTVRPRRSPSPWAATRSPDRWTSLSSEQPPSRKWRGLLRVQDREEVAMLLHPVEHVGSREDQVLGRTAGLDLLPRHGSGHRGAGPGAQRVRRHGGLGRVVL